MVLPVQASNSRAHFLELAEPRWRMWRWSNFVKALWGGIVADDCIDLAAQMAFYFSLSLFPLLIVIAALVGLMPSTNLWHNLAQWITDYLPRESRRVVFNTILELTRDSTGFLSFGLVTCLWTASSGFVSLMESLTVAYGVKETRGFWKKRVIAICATFVAAGFLAACFGILTFGRWAAILISFHLRYVLPFSVPWEIVRWLATLLLMFVGLDLVHFFLPNVKSVWKWWTPGTVFVAFTFVTTSLGFNFYLAHFGNYPRFYGAMAGFIVLMTWAYFGSLILLIGAEADSVLYERKGRGSFE